MRIVQLFFQNPCLLCAMMIMSVDPPPHCHCSTYCGLLLPKLWCHIYMHGSIGFGTSLYKYKLLLSHPALTKTCYFVQRYGSCEVEFCFNSSNFHETCRLYSVWLVFRQDASELNGKIDCESRVACFFTLSIPMD